MQKRFDKTQCRQKGISTLIVIIIAVAVVVVAGFFANKYLVTPGPNNPHNPQKLTQNQNVQTADWKTFKSNIFDYEVKFPATYEILPGFVSTPHSGSDTDTASYTNKDYHFDFTVLARNEDFIMKDCLKDLAGRNITDTKEVNGNTFYAIYDKKQGTGGRMALAEGAIESEYHIIHNGYCYIIRYTIVPINLDNLPKPTETNSQFEVLSQIFSTFKFTTPAGQTAGWKTYTNAQYGFEFQYPQKYEPIEQETSYLFVGGLSKVKALFKALSNNKGLSVAVVPINTYKFSNTGGETIYYDLINNRCAGELNNDLEKNNTLSFQGAKGCYIGDADALGGFIGYLIPNIKNQQIVEVTVSYGADKAEAVQNLSRMLATFRFTK